MVEEHGSVEPGKGFIVGNGYYTFCGGIEINYAAGDPEAPGGIGDITISGGTITTETSSQVLQIGEKPEQGQSIKEPLFSR